jgi:hypothetical protein
VGGNTAVLSRAIGAGPWLEVDLQGENCRGGQFGGAQAGRCEEACCCCARLEEGTLGARDSERVRFGAQGPRARERVWQALVGAQGGVCAERVREGVAGRKGTDLKTNANNTNTNNKKHQYKIVINSTRAGTARISRPSSWSARRTSTRGPATSASRSASRCRSTSSCPTSTGRTRWARADAPPRIPAEGFGMFLTAADGRLYGLRFARREVVLCTDWDLFVGGLYPARVGMRWFGCSAM